MRPDFVFEIKEMMEHKYFKSLQAHKDIGEEAYLDWAKTQALRFREAYEKHASEIEAICKEKCPQGCRGPEDCPLDIAYIHQLLED